MSDISKIKKYFKRLKNRIDRIAKKDGLNQEEYTLILLKLKNYDMKELSDILYNKKNLTYILKNMKTLLKILNDNKDKTDINYWHFMITGFYNMIDEKNNGTPVGQSEFGLLAYKTYDYDRLFAGKDPQFMSLVVFDSYEEDNTVEDILSIMKRYNNGNEELIMYNYLNKNRIKNKKLKKAEKNYKKQFPTISSSLSTSTDAITLPNKGHKLGNTLGKKIKKVNTTKATKLENTLAEKIKKMKENKIKRLIDGVFTEENLQNLKKNKNIEEYLKKILSVQVNNYISTNHSNYNIKQKELITEYIFKINKTGLISLLKNKELLTKEIEKFIKQKRNNKKQKEINANAEAARSRLLNKKENNAKKYQEMIKEHKKKLEIEKQRKINANAKEKANANAKEKAKTIQLQKEKEEIEKQKKINANEKAIQKSLLNAAEKKAKEFQKAKANAIELQKAKTIQLQKEKENAIELQKTKNIELEKEKEEIEKQKQINANEETKRNNLLEKQKNRGNIFKKAKEEAKAKAEAKARGEKEYNNRSNTTAELLSSTNNSSSNLSSNYDSLSNYGSVMSDNTVNNKLNEDIKKIIKLAKNNARNKAPKRVKTKRGNSQEEYNKRVRSEKLKTYSKSVKEIKKILEKKGKLKELNKYLYPIRKNAERILEKDGTLNYAKQKVHTGINLSFVK